MPMCMRLYWLFYNLRLEQTMAVSRVSSQEPVGFKMPVWFFLLLPLTISAHHPQNDGHQDHLAPKVLILMKKWRVYKNNVLGLQKVRRPLHIGQMERVGRMTDRVRRLFILLKNKPFKLLFTMHWMLLLSSFNPSRSLPRLRICWTQLKTMETWFT